LHGGAAATEHEEDGGSIRVPAGFCGIYRHKPSQGLIPTRGHAPPGSDGTGVALAVIGPLARTASDLALALDILAGPDADEAVAYRLDLASPRHARLSDYRVLVVDQHPSIATDSELRAALGGLADRLAGAGAHVARSSPLLPDAALNARAYQTMLLALLMRGQPAEFYEQIAATVRSLPADDQSLGAARLRGMVLPTRDFLALGDIQARIRAQWAALFQEWDVVVCPSFGTPAPPHDDTPPSQQRWLTIDGQQTPYADQLAWPGVATFPGLPATVMPIGRSRDGLPLGAQVIGPFLEDRTTTAFAGLVELEFGGFTLPPGFA
jgi:amidase